LSPALISLPHPTTLCVAQVRIAVFGSLHKLSAAQQGAKASITHATADKFLLVLADLKEQDAVGRLHELQKSAREQHRKSMIAMAPAAVLDTTAGAAAATGGGPMSRNRAGLVEAESLVTVSCKLLNGVTVTAHGAIAEVRGRQLDRGLDKGLDRGLDRGHRRGAGTPHTHPSPSTHLTPHTPAPHCVRQALWLCGEVHRQRGDFLEAKRLLVPSRAVARNLRALFDAAVERAAKEKADEAARQVCARPLSSAHLPPISYRRRRTTTCCNPVARRRRKVPRARRQ